MPTANDNPDRPTVLWWSRSGRDYSRDRIIRESFSSLGWKIEDFAPKISATADLEARWRRIKRPDLVWVPCFRQRDTAAAQRWAAANNVPLIFDPLISAWDKQVSERQKFAPRSFRSQRLRAQEAKLFQQSSAVVADTDLHADFFSSTFEVARSNIITVPVSAEESLFFPAENPRPAVQRPNILFYGSFIGLQGPQNIARAAREYPNAHWTFIGSGPLKDECVSIAGECSHVTFEDQVPYKELPNRIRSADILLGIFGDTPKASRVIPNKAYQALACGRPLITRISDAYPFSKSSSQNSGVSFCEPGNADAICRTVDSLLDLSPLQATRLSDAASQSYRDHFGNDIVRNQLAKALTTAGLPPRMLTNIHAA